MALIHLWGREAGRGGREGGREEGREGGREERSLIVV